MRALAAFIFATSLMCGPVNAAGEQFTASSVLPGCEEYITQSKGDYSRVNVASAMRVGRCVGIIETLMMLSATGSTAGPTNICFPDRATTDQLIKVAVR
jgi:hypothetical protein